MKHVPAYSTIGLSRLLLTATLSIACDPPTTTAPTPTTTTAPTIKTTTTPAPIETHHLTDQWWQSQTHSTQLIHLTDDISKHFVRQANPSEAITPQRGGQDGVITIRPEVGHVQTIESFTDFCLHIEWYSPPGGLGQFAGNSGVFLQGIYELQVLGTHAAKTNRHPSQQLQLANNEAGAIYSYKSPDRNASTGPGTWQSYDIWFQAARTDPKGNITTPAQITKAYWNNQLIHQNVTLLGGTSGGYPNQQHQQLKRIATEQVGVQSQPNSYKLTGPLVLQSHASMAQGPVRYRNIWIQPLNPK